jgi:hypothetical protein
MEHDNENEGMSTGKKVVAGAAIGVAVPAAVGVAKKLLGNGDDEQDGGSSGTQRSQQGGRKSTAGSSSGQSRSRSSASKRGSSSSKRTSSSSRSGSSRGSSGKSGSSSRRSASSSGGGATRTKEQLYNQAKRLKIEGRSNMTKAQLERAISRAK